MNDKYSELRPYTGEHSGKIKEPTVFSKFKRQDNKFGEGIHVVYGIRKKDAKEVAEVQAITFNASNWTVKEAKKWLKDHNWKPIKFEPASDTKSFSDIVLGMTEN